MTTETEQRITTSGDADEYHTEITGERPPIDIPGSRKISVPGIQNEEGFSKVIKRGHIRKLIRTLHEQGKYVAAKWSPGEVTLFIANHRKLLIALGVTGGAGRLVYNKKIKRKKMRNHAKFW